MRLRTQPTKSRRVAAIVLVIACTACAVLDKTAREFGTGVTIVPSALSGVWPNFAVVLGTTLLLFVTTSEMPFADYIKFALVTAVGMMAYEFAQIWMPARTFDVLDILASFAGALVSVCLARVMSYRNASAPAGKQSQ